MSRELIDPSEPIQSKLQHVFEKGWISRHAADQLLETAVYAETEAANLAAQYPDKILAVVRKSDGAFQTLVGDDHLAVESQAVEFFPGTPFAIVPTPNAFQTVPPPVPIQDAKADPTKCQVDGAWTDAAGVTKKKVWRIDTQADESMISTANVIGSQVKIGGVAPVMGVTGAGLMLKLVDTKMTFPAEPAGGGKPEDVVCDLPVLLGSADLLGRDQLKKTGVELIFNAARGETTLRKPPEKKK